MRTALIVVDLQKDFCPGGALAVKDGDLIITGINEIINSHTFQGLPIDYIIATQDFHPANHGSFAVNHPGKKPFDMGTLGGDPQVMWPAHCVQGTPGVKFHQALADKFDHITQKGTDPKIDSYSGFFDNNRRKATDLNAYLKEHKVTDLYICGLATDYCVAATAMDAVELGYRVHLLANLCKGVDLTPGDCDRKVAEMAAKGIIVIPRPPELEFN